MSAADLRPRTTAELAAEYREVAELATLRGALALAVHCDDIADKLEHQAQHETLVMLDEMSVNAAEFVGTPSAGTPIDRTIPTTAYVVPIDPASLNDCEACQ